MAQSNDIYKSPDPFLSIRMKEYKELYETALKCKNEGNQHFKASNYKEAKDQYLLGDKLIEYQTIFTYNTIDKEKFENLMNLKKDLKLNAALSNIKLNNFLDAVGLCTEVIKNFPNKNSKAYYRRALAYKGLEMFEEAMNDALKATTDEPQEETYQKTFDEIKLLSTQKK